MNNKAFDNGEEKYKEGDYEGAVIDFTLALEKDPGNPEILYQRGMSYFHLKRKSLALIDMDSAVEMQPNYSYRYSSRAFMRDAFGDVVGAIADYRRAIELDPKDSISYNNLGILEDKMGRREISQAFYNKADELMELPENKEVKNFRSESSSINYSRKEVESSENEVVLDDQNKSIFTEALKVFTNLNSFKEFLQFLKSGFKIPEK